MGPTNTKKKVEQWEAVIAQLHQVILDDCYERLVKPLAARVHLLEKRLDLLSPKEAQREIKDFQKFLQHLRDWSNNGKQ